MSAPTAAQPSDVDRKSSDGKWLVERRHQDWLEHNMFSGARCRIRSKRAHVTEMPSTGPTAAGSPSATSSVTSANTPTRSDTPTSSKGTAVALAVGETSASSVSLGPWPGMLGADPGATAQDDDYELGGAAHRCPSLSASASGFI